MSEPTGPKGYKNTFGETIFACANYRANENEQSFCGSSPSCGVVLADLYDETGKFFRTAAVADCGDVHSARRYAKEQNRKQGATDATAQPAGVGREAAEVVASGEDISNSLTKQDCGKRSI